MLFIIIISAILVSIVLLIICTRRENIQVDFKDLKYKEIKNLYGKGTLYWPKQNNFMEKNFPNTIDFDQPIKLDFYEYCLKLPKNSGIIDCGAHIGDLSIPIAKALADSGREDIVLYAIDPSDYKCEFIRKVADYNKIKNIKIINCGLSDKYEKLCSEKQNHNNTGGMHWSNDANKISEHCMIFDTIDNLIKNNKINHTIRAIHLDVEGHEDKALNGISNFENIEYLSVECHMNDDNQRSLTKYVDEILLTKQFKFLKRLEANNVYIK